MSWICSIMDYERACNAQCNFLVNICVIARLPNESPEFTHNLFISCLPSPNFVLFIDDGRPFQPKGNYFCCSWSIVVRRKMYRQGIIYFHQFANLILRQFFQKQVLSSLNDHYASEKKSKWMIEIIFICCSAIQIIFLSTSLQLSE